MFPLSDKFRAEYDRMEEQFNGWSPFEQFYAALELTKKLHLSYRYFLSQAVFHTNNQQENNDMFHHTIYQANTPAILACLLSEPMDKIISTLQLYLPLVSIKTPTDKLLTSYRDVFVYLDSKLTNPSNFTYTEQQLIHLCQQIQFFIQINPRLQPFSVDLSNLNTLAAATTTTTIMTNKGNTDEKSLSPATQRHHQPLQRYRSVRHYENTSASPPVLITNFSSEGSTNSLATQPLIRTNDRDSGVDLSEPSVANLLSAHNSQHPIIGRSYSANVTLNNAQDNQFNHSSVVKTSSSPTPEKPVSNRSCQIPLSAVLSAPTQSIHSYYSDFHLHQHSAFHQPKVKSTLPKSDEDEEDSQKEQCILSHSSQISPKSMENFYSDVVNNKRLRQFSSFRTHSPRVKVDGVSSYLAVDSHPSSIRNTFVQANSGMRDVPKWLKNLRLHKYAFFFSQMTYDQMMNLTIEQLKKEEITDGACTKILINIRKLKERQMLLQQCLMDIEHGQTDLKTVLQQLNELFLTPIRVKQIESDPNEEDLPKLIMQVLEKAYQQLTSNATSTSLFSEMCNNLVSLFDRCYKHEAFSADQRHTLLHWRGPLCNKLQTSGKIEFKSMQSSSSTLNRRVQLKPQTSMGNMNTGQVTQPIVRNIRSTLSYHPNHQSSSIPLSRPYNSELVAQTDSNHTLTDSNLIRRPSKSPTFLFTTDHKAKDDPSEHLSIVSSYSLQEQSSYHQASTAFHNDRSGNLRPGMNYINATRHNRFYLAANQHELLARKASVDPDSGEGHSDDKSKLCKTFSDPSKIRFYNSTQMSNLQSSTHSPIPSQPTNYLTASTPYAPRQYLSRSQSSATHSNHLFDSEGPHQSPIEKYYSDREASVFYGNDSNTEHVEHAYSQRHNSTDFETFCRQFTESAMSDDVPNQKEDSLDICNTKSSSNDSTDNEQ